MLIDGDKLVERIDSYKNNLNELVNITELTHNRVRYQAALSMLDQLLKDIPSLEIAEPTKRGVRRTDNAEARKASTHNLGDSTARTLALQALHRLKEATTEEICDAVRAAHPGKYSANSLERRVTDLVQMGVAVKTGETRKNKSGRPADVLRIAS